MNKKNKNTVDRFPEIVGFEEISLSEDERISGGESVWYYIGVGVGYVIAGVEAFAGAASEPGYGYASAKCG